MSEFVGFLESQGPNLTIIIFSDDSINVELWEMLIYVRHSQCIVEALNLQIVDYLPIRILRPIQFQIQMVKGFLFFIPSLVELIVQKTLEDLDS